VINVDGGGGMLAEDTAKPLAWTWDGAEKNYADFQLEVTNPGGHSSAPRKDNAIVQLEPGAGGDRRLSLHARTKPADQGVLRKRGQDHAQPASGRRDARLCRRSHRRRCHRHAARLPEFIGRIETTCVPTMVNGGHALNALPQRATANINCRIFPGHKREDIMAELAKVANMPVVKFSDVTEGSTPSPASPMRPDFVNAANKAIHWPIPASR
jgi:acetylornithine deacetylase/succinyl-diaminopimelate desuccinylase-like protein